MGMSEETVNNEKKTYSPDELCAAVEAILFTMGDAVAISDIAKALDTTPKDIQRAADKYGAADSGVMIRQLDDALQLSTKPEQFRNLIRIAKVPKKVTLSDSVLETLSIIAYKQPVTKAEVEQIRGVSSEYAFNKLLEYDLIRLSISFWNTISSGNSAGKTRRVGRFFSARRSSSCAASASGDSKSFRK